MRRATSSPQSHRAELWAELVKAIAFTKQAVGSVAAVWVAGSFATTKADPGDIDTTFIIEQSAFNRALKNQAQAQWVGLLANNSLPPQDFRLDTFVVPWRVMPDIKRGMTRAEAYFAERGHWDDFWQRQRTGPKGSASVRSDAIPRRGYLEVIVDGYQ